MGTRGSRSREEVSADKVTVPWLLNVGHAITALPVYKGGLASHDLPSCRQVYQSLLVIGALQHVSIGLMRDMRAEDVGSWVL